MLGANNGSMGLDSDSLLVVLGGILSCVVIGCLPATIRVIRIRHLERRLGRAFWSWLAGVDTQSSRLPEHPPHDC